MSNALNHIREAHRLLTSEAYCIPSDRPHEEHVMENFCGIAADLERIDSAIGRKGETAFASMAETIRAAYVEIIAAMNALEDT